MFGIKILSVLLPNTFNLVKESKRDENQHQKMVELVFSEMSFLIRLRIKKLFISSDPYQGNKYELESRSVVGMKSGNKFSKSF